MENQNFSKHKSSKMLSLLFGDSRRKRNRYFTPGYDVQLFSCSTSHFAVAIVIRTFSK